MIRAATLPADSDQPTAYGWVVVVALTILLGASHGLITSGISIFDPSILKDLEITRGALKLRDLIQLFSAGIWALVIGFAATRLGPRTVIYAGLILLSGVLMAYAHISSITQIYFLHFLLAFCYSSCHVVVVLLILTKWFALRRNAALGIILAGESLGGTIFPQIGVYLIDTHGWRGAMQWLAPMPLILLGMLLLVLRESPERMGRRPYGWAPDVRTEQSGKPSILDEKASGFSAQLLRPQVLLVMLIAALIFYVGGGVASHSFLFLRDQGFTAAHAAGGLSLFFAMAFIGKLSSGFISERWRLLNVWLVFQATMLIGIVAITFYVGVLPYLIIACLGLGWGGCYTLSQALLMERFAGPYLARLSGATVLVEGLASGLGSFGTGLFYDRFGNYAYAFALMGLSLSLAIGFSLMLRRQSSRPQA